MALKPRTEPFGLEPKDAVAWFRSKGYRMSFDWRDTWSEQHANAFTVAKAMQLDVLADILEAVDAAIAEGSTKREFQKRLKPLLQKKGWWGEKEVTDPKTGETKTVQLGSARRLSVIYDTNLRTAHAAGKWQRIERNARRRPYLRYIPREPGKNRRDDHQLLRDLVLPVDHPAWRKLMPPNDWGCKCGVQQLSARDVERLGLRIGHTADGPFKLEYETVTNKRTGETREVPKGVGPGWDYNPGLVRRVSDPVDNLPVLDPVNTYRDYQRPAADDLVDDDLPAAPPSKVRSGDSPLDAFRRVFGTRAGKPAAVIKDPTDYQVSFSEDQLLEGQQRGSQRWFGHAKATVEDPYEVWLVPHRRKDGSVTMRRRYVGAFKGKQQVVVVVEDNGAFRTIPTSRLDEQRSGYLLYSRPKPARPAPPVRETSVATWQEKRTPEQRRAFEHWSEDGYEVIRALQRGLPLNEAQVKRAEESIEQLDAALETAPKFRGRIYRGISLESEDDLRRLFPVGGFYSTEALSSFSQSEGRARTFAFDGGGEVRVIVQVDGQRTRAHDIAALSSLSNEQEVLMQKGEMFQVVDVSYEDRDGLWRVVMKE